MTPYSADGLMSCTDVIVFDDRIETMRQKELADGPSAFASYFDKQFYCAITSSPVELGGQTTIVRVLITFSSNIPNGDCNSYRTL